MNIRGDEYTMFTDNAEMCEERRSHSETVNTVLGDMPDDIVFAKTAVFFKALADETRTKIIWALDRHEMCVCDLADTLAMTPSAISHQLATLKIAGLVSSRRQGKEIFYSLSDDHVRSMLESGIEHTQE